MAQFLDPLDVEEINDTDFRIVNHPFCYQSDIYGGIITVPVGFETDFASTWNHKYAKRAGTVHDWLYFSALVDKSAADDILREAMLADQQGAFRARSYWLAVRTFGWIAWNRHRAANDELKYGV